MATNYYQDPLGAPDYSAQGMPSLLSLSNLESLGRGSVAGLFDLPYFFEGMLMGDEDPRMPQRKRVVPSSEQVLATTPRMTQPTPQAGLLETAGAFMSPAPVAAVKPVAQAVGKGGKALGKAYLKEIDAAMMGERGGLLGAITPQPKQIFIGENAKTWNKSDANKFLKLEESGADPVTAWQQTGTFRSPDGKLRQEISDAKSMSGEKLYSWGEATDLQRGNSAIVRRQKALLHPELSAAYPDTKNIIVSLKPNRTGGYYEMWRDNIGVPVIGENNAADRSLMLHELQHAIQQREGFAAGANPNAPYPAGVRDQIIRDQLKELKEITKYDPSNPYSSPNTLTDEELLQMAIRNTDEQNGVGRMQAYLRSAGEAEARAVQSRMNMTPEQRLQKFPLESYDVPIGSLLFPTP